MKKKKACYTPAAVKNGRVSKAHKTYSNPGPAKAGAVRLAKAAGGKPVVVRSNGGRQPFDSVEEYEASKLRAAARSASRARTAAGRLANKYGGSPEESGELSIGWGGRGAAGQRIRYGHAHWRVDTLPAKLQYGASTHDGMEDIAAYILDNHVAPTHQNPPRASSGGKRANPKNPLRQVVLGHTVTWSPKKGGYVIDAYQMVFPKVKELRAYLKEHVAKELRHR